MIVTCPNCGGQHPKWECRAKPAQIAAWKAKQKPASAGVAGAGMPLADRAPTSATKKSTAARKDVPQRTAKLTEDAPEPGVSKVSDERIVTPPTDTAGTQAPPVDTPKRKTAKQVKAELDEALAKIKKGGRPKKHPDRKAYRKEWMAKDRARKRAEKAGK